MPRFETDYLEALGRECAMSPEERYVQSARNIGDILAAHDRQVELVLTAEAQV